jgi:hypothetical protein
MTKGFLSFLFVFGLFFFGINAVRSMTGREKWALTKLVTYSIICAALTLLVLIGIVLIF